MIKNDKLRIKNKKQRKWKTEFEQIISTMKPPCHYWESILIIEFKNKYCLEPKIDEIKLMKLKYKELKFY